MQAGLEAYLDGLDYTQLALSITGARCKIPALA